jgi:hypothetical protein
MNQNEDARELFDTTPEPNDWETRRNLMSEEEVRRLSEEKGKGADGAVRAHQAGHVGPEPEGEPSRRADMEGGVRGRFQGKLVQEFEAEDRQEDI